MSPTAYHHIHVSEVRKRLSLITYPESTLNHALTVTHNIGVYLGPCFIKGTKCYLVPTNSRIPPNFEIVTLGEQYHLLLFIIA